MILRLKKHCLQHSGDAKLSGSQAGDTSHADLAKKKKTKSPRRWCIDFWIMCLKEHLLQYSDVANLRVEHWKTRRFVYGDSHSSGETSEETL